MISESLFIEAHGADPVAQGSPKIVRPTRGRAGRGKRAPRAWERLSASELRERAGGGEERRALAKDSPRLADWREALEAMARTRRVAERWEPPRGGPVAVAATFRFAWTDDALRVAKRDPLLGVLKATRPDLDKLQRAVGDALEAAGVVEEDSRILWWPAPIRVYREPPGVDLAVRRVTPELAKEILRTSGARP